MVSLEAEVMVFFYAIQAAEMGGKKPGPMMELLAGAIIPLGSGGTKFPPLNKVTLRLTLALIYLRSVD